MASRERMAEVAPSAKPQIRFLRDAARAPTGTVGNRITRWGSSADPAHRFL